MHLQCRLFILETIAHFLAVAEVQWNLSEVQWNLSEFSGIQRNSAEYSGSIHDYYRWYIERLRDPPPWVPINKLPILC